MSNLDHCTAWPVEPEQQAAIAAACAQHMQDCRVQGADLRTLIHRMADELDRYRRILHDDRSPYHPLAAKARAALAEPEPEGPLADTHYEWELEDAEGEWQAGGSSNSQSDVEREGMRYLQTYAQDGPHKLIIRQHTTQIINEIANG